MNNNAIINTRLTDLFRVMDLRANVNIFNKELDVTDERLIRSDKLYKLISDGEFLSAFGSYKVIGLTVTLGVTSILIEAEAPDNGSEQITFDDILEEV